MNITLSFALLLFDIKFPKLTCMSRAPRGDYRGNGHRGRSARGGNVSNRTEESNGDGGEWQTAGSGGNFSNNGFQDGRGGFRGGEFAKYETYRYHYLDLPLC